MLLDPCKLAYRTPTRWPVRTDRCDPSTARPLLTLHLRCIGCVLIAESMHGGAACIAVCRHIISPPLAGSMACAVVLLSDSVPPSRNSELLRPLRCADGCAAVTT